MDAPRLRYNARVPRRAIPALFAAVAIFVALAAWAVLLTRTTSDESSRGPVVQAPASIGSVAYAIPDRGLDTVYVRRVGAAAGDAVAIASFPYLFAHLRGSASPTGSHLAVVHLDTPGRNARLSLLTVASREVRDVDGEFDYLSAMAWRRDGSQLAVVRSVAGAPGEPPPSTSVAQVDVQTGETVEVARFESALEVVPVGYSLGGDRLFIVVLGQSGSSLWEQHAGKLRRLAILSPGPTRHWSMSPDSSRLAFVARLGLGERTYAGRVVVIATGAISDAARSGDQLGSAWRPGSPVPDFGGPGGSLQLTDAPPGGYVVPMQWAPDGSSLVVATYVANGATASAPAFEIVTPTTRVKLAEAETVLFLGYVGNIE